MKTNSFIKDLILFLFRMRFVDFNLREELIKGLDDLKYITLTPIQEGSIGYVMEGKDFIGIAQTGTGKTATFALPILNLLLEQNKQAREQYPRALILAPTRELCTQIGQNINSYAKYTSIKSLVTFGGVSSEPQIEALKGKVDILIATPGRLVDLVGQKDVFLDDVVVFVLDEADNIIKMGLRVDLGKIMKKLPKVRQNLFFSATMDKKTKAVAKELLVDPVKVEVDAEEISLKLIEQNVLYVLKEHKIKALLELLGRKEVKNAIIFTNSKSTADDIVRSLTKNNIKSEALHSGKSNTHREKVVRHIKSREVKFLVATDLASRGLDFCDMGHVINFEIPRDYESYVHRVGRIGRAGKNGVSFSLCSLDERDFFKKIEEGNKYPIKIVMHDFHSNLVKSNGGNKSRATYFKPKKKRSTTGYNNRKNH